MKKRKTTNAQCTPTDWQSAVPTENRRSSVGVYRTPTRSSGLIGAIPPIRNLNRCKSQSALVGRCVPNFNPIVVANRQVCIEFMLDSTVGGKLTNHSYHFRARLDLAAIFAPTGIDYFTHFRHFLFRCFHPTSFKTSLHIISDAKTTFSYIHYCMLLQYANIYTDYSTIPLPGFE